MNKIIFQKFTTKQVADALFESIDSYERADDKDDQCNPEVPLLININGKKHYVLSVGGDPDEEGLILEAKPASYWEK